MTQPVVKICGLTRPEDARLCFEAGADLLGMIFAPSPRRIDLRRALEIRCSVEQARLVGVFGEASAEEIADAVAAARLDVVQLHACDDPARWEAVARAAGVPVLPAVTAERAEQAAEAVLARGDLPLAGLLLDLPKGAVERDGAAREELWAAARACVTAGARVVLAGALDAGAVAAARRAVGPYGLDVCRGVEESPGVKDPARVRRFLAAARHPEVNRAP
jgi:phosphoribosylanthranilate isomerase